MVTGADMEQARYSGSDPNRPSYKLAALRATDGDRGGRGDLIQQLRGNNPSHHPLPTLLANDHKSGKRKGPFLNSRPLREVLPPDLEGQAIGPLNPTWCEWYQGFPIGWTALED
jgi:hypothetical protein